MATKNSINNKTGPLTITDSADITKEILYDVSPVSTGTTRTWTMDDRNIDFDAVATSISTDSGTCTPAGGSFSIVGSGGSTSASGSTITVTAGGAGSLDVGFLARLSENEDNVTGDGTTHVVGSTEGFTEMFDAGSDFNASTGVFTAPSTAKYRFDFAVNMQDFDSSDTFYTLVLNSSNGSFLVHKCNPYACSTGGKLSVAGSILIDMDSSDTAKLEVTVTSGLKDIDVGGAGTPFNTWFSGNLVG